MSSESKKNTMVQERPRADPTTSRAENRKKDTEDMKTPVSYGGFEKWCLE
jgi:hypothetical protein